MNILESAVARSRALVSDGAWGTEFAKRGLELGTAPEVWNLERPKEVEAVAGAYVEAGSDIILTNSFGGNSFKLSKLGLSGKVEEINRRAGEISKGVAGKRVIVLGSIGPTGEFMEPLGSISEAAMIEVYAVQAKALVSGGVDGIVIETMMDLDEALAALKAVKENTDAPVVVSMTFSKGPRGYATIMGIRPENAGEALAEAGADVVGANCGAGIDDMIQVMSLMRASVEIPLWAKPNAGLPELMDGRTVFRETPEETVGKLPELVRAGATIVGGCCGSGPAHIRCMAEWVRGYNSEKGR